MIVYLTLINPDPGTINPGKHQHYACGINDYTRILSGLMTQTGALIC